MTTQKKNRFIPRSGYFWPHRGGGTLSVGEGAQAAGRRACADDKSNLTDEERLEQQRVHLPGQTQDARWSSRNADGRVAGGRATSAAGSTGKPVAGCGARGGSSCLRARRRRAACGIRLVSRGRAADGGGGAGWKLGGGSSDGSRGGAQAAATRDRAAAAAPAASRLEGSVGPCSTTLLL